MKKKLFIIFFSFFRIDYKKIASNLISLFFLNFVFGYLRWSSPLQYVKSIKGMPKFTMIILASDHILFFLVVAELLWNESSGWIIDDQLTSNGSLGIFNSNN